jgi:hypothetical protein
MEMDVVSHGKASPSHMKENDLEACIPNVKSKAVPLRHAGLKGGGDGVTNYS